MKNKILSIAIVLIMLTQMSPFVSMTANAAESDLITIEINGYYNNEENTISSSAIEFTGTCLSDAVKKHTAGNPPIEKLKITAGTFTISDWEYIFSLKKLKHFEIAEDVKVAEMPTDTLLSTSIFPKSIFSVNIPQLTNVGNTAFNECKSLTKVNLPKVTKIGEYAFRQCSMLSNVNIPEVKTIEPWAFNGCSSLETAEFLEATVIGNAAFNSCTNLKTAKFPNATEITGGAFGNCVNLLTVEIENVLEIGNTAFKDCKGLTTLNFPNLTAIGAGTFNGCTSLQEITAPLVSEIGKSAFMDCTVLKTADFPKLESISYEAFKNCNKLTTINFPDVKKIEGQAFYNCRALATVTFPAVTAIGTYAFNGCTSLTAVDFPMATEISESQFHNLDALREVDFPKLESIPKMAFSNCDKLTTVKFPKLKTIGENAFSNSAPLTTVTFPEVTDIGTSAFSGCGGLTTVDFPMAIEIGESAFNFCQKLISANFPNAETLGKLAFSNCQALKTINFPSVNTIGKQAFFGCNKLETINFPSVITIGNQAFYRCWDLNTVSLPKITNIATNAFQNCNKLGTLKLGPTPPAVIADSFLDTLKTNPLVLLDAEGGALTGSNLTEAQAAYKVVNDGNTSDELWFGWNIMNLPEATYKVIGAVQDVENKSISDAAVKLMKGNTQVGTENIITNSAGEFTITDVPNGTYNLVVSKAKITVTSLVVVNSLDNNLTSAILLPSGKTSSVVEISGSETPEIVVGNLDVQFSFHAEDEKKGVTPGDNTVVASGGSVEIKFIAEKKMEEDASNSGDIKLKAQSNGKTVNTFLNLMVLKTVTTTTGAVTTTTLSELQELIKIVIPLGLEMQGQTEYVIYRYHGAEVDTITTTANADDEFIAVNEDDKITLHAKKFSTYAIGYKSTAVSPPPSGGSGGSGSNNSFNSNKENNYSESSGVLITQPVNGPGIPYYIKNDSKVYIGFSALSGDKYKYIVPNGATVEFEDNSKNFLDNNLEWSKTSIDFVTQREIFLGVNQNIFGHDETMTRGMFVTVMGRLYERSYGGISIGDTFSDVDLDAYYGKYVAWANKNGIIKGVGEDKFLPNERVTREQMAVIILNFARFLENADFAQASLEYIDKEEISYWATEGAKYCQETQVITGRSGGQFAPQESATRAEVAVVVERFIKDNLK